MSIWGVNARVNKVFYSDDMKKGTLILLLALFLFSCEWKKQSSETPAVAADSVSGVDAASDESNIEDSLAFKKRTEEFAGFIPAKYRITQIIEGDLNKDEKGDCILIVKDTDADNIVDDEYRGELDRNRRGIVILFKDGTSYKPVIRNYSCFSSENEDGGVYFAPELFVEINKRGNLEIQYLHGRYGTWLYMFRYQNEGFEMIGFKSNTNHGPVEMGKVSVNFLTKKVQRSHNVSDVLESGNEEWEETWQKIKIDRLIQLSEIEDFDALSLDDYYTIID